MNEKQTSADKKLMQLVLAMLKEARDMETGERNQREAGETVGEWARGYRGGYVQAVRDLCARAGVQPDTLGDAGGVLHVCPTDGCDFKTGRIELWPECPTHKAPLLSSSESPKE